MSHKKKDLDSLSKGRYSRGMLQQVVKDVLNRKTTVQKANADHGIPVQTIQHHVKCVEINIFKIYFQ